MCDTCSDAPRKPREIDPGFYPGKNTQAETCGQLARGMSDEEKLDQIFTYHPLSPPSELKAATIRAAAHYFAKVILMNAPPGADRTCAIRHVRDAVMTANAGVSLNGLSL